MILVDTGPLVALFDPAEEDHQLCRRILRDLEERLVTTLPVLTEAFHVLNPSSLGSRRLMDLIAGSGISVWSLKDEHLSRAFELMVKYSDQPMDLADASLVVAAELNQLKRIFTLDRRDFATYRIKHGHRHVPFKIIP